MQTIPFNPHEHKIFLIDYRTVKNFAPRSYLTWATSRKGAEHLTKEMEGKNFLKITRITPFDVDDFGIKTEE